VSVCHLPLADHGSPSLARLREVAEKVVELIRQGHEVLVHCRAGQERAPTVACAVLVLQGWTLSDAFRRVAEVRPMALPTSGQLEALRQLADEVPGARGG